MIPRPDNPLIVALDVSEVDAAEAMARRLDGEAGILKVGLELFAAHGPEAVSRMRAFAPVFLDVKLHDIPTTVEGAARVDALRDRFVADLRRLMQTAAVLTRAPAPRPRPGRGSPSSGYVGEPLPRACVR